MKILLEIGVALLPSQIVIVSSCDGSAYYYDKMKDVYVVDLPETPLGFDVGGCLIAGMKARNESLEGARDAIAKIAGDYQPEGVDDICAKFSSRKI
ncbi:hypothetical protein IKF04_02100 [Candidatus Saccharibacteria bacterium]|nr:hypothetical protein [Candidatus Saccharibacteria bacterium]